MADAEAGAEGLKTENAKDLRGWQREGSTDAMLDRLTLSDKVISGMAGGLREVAALKDPVGEVSDLSVMASRDSCRQDEDSSWGCGDNL